MNTDSIIYRFTTLLLRAGLVVALFAAGWFVYVKLPHGRSANNQTITTTNLEIVMQPGMNGASLDVPIQVFPIDLVAVRHEYFAERRAGKRFEDFLQERMNGRTPITAHLDAHGRTTLLAAPGNWWIHAVVSGEEDLEWRLPITVTDQKQTIELNRENAYTRAKSF